MDAGMETGPGRFVISVDIAALFRYYNMSNESEEGDIL